MDTALELTKRAGRFAQLTGGSVGAADLAEQRGSAAELAQICQAWGAAIAALHTTSTHHSSAPLAARPSVVNPRHLTVSMSGATARSGYAAVRRAYESSRDLQAAIREVDERWTELHWIHGDLTASNVQVELRPALRVSFLGLKDAGLGDPAWDLATAVDMITWCRHAGVRCHSRWWTTSSWDTGKRADPAGSIRPCRPYGHWLPPSGSRRRRMGRQGRSPAEAELATWLDRAQAYAARVGCLMAGRLGLP